MANRQSIPTGRHCLIRSGRRRSTNTEKMNPSTPAATSSKPHFHFQAFQHRHEKGNRYEQDDDDAGEPGEPVQQHALGGLSGRNLRPDQAPDAHHVAADERNEGLTEECADQHGVQHHGDPALLVHPAAAARAGETPPRRTAGTASLCRSEQRMAGMEASVAQALPNSILRNAYQTSPADSAILSRQDQVLCHLK